MQKFTLREHFLELKSRIIKVLSFFIITFFICYYYSDSIYQFLLEPLARNSQAGVRKVIYTGLAEAFVTYIKLSLFSAFLLSLPIICWHIYSFAAPGLHKREKIIISLALILSPILFFIGGFFVFYLIMPKAWHFFLSFENKNALLPLVLEARVSEYLSLVMQLIMAFGLAFQMPIIMIIGGAIGLITSETLRKRRRLAVVINFIIAAIFTPPDVLSQIGLALPLLLLYEFSIILCKLVENKRE